MLNAFSRIDLRGRFWLPLWNRVDKRCRLINGRRHHI